MKLDLNHNPFVYSGVKDHVKKLFAISKQACLCSRTISPRRSLTYLRS